MQKRNILSNVIYSSIYQIMAVLIPLVTAPYLSRVLGAEQTGVYSYIYATANYFVVFAILGISNYGSRKISQLREDPQESTYAFLSIYLFHAITTTIMLVAYYLYFLFFLSDSYSGPGMAASLFVWSSLFDISWFFAGKERFKMTALVSTFSKFLCAVAIFLFVKTPEDVSIYTLIMALSHVFTYLIPWLFLKGELDFGKFDIKRIKIKQHILPSLIFFVPVIAITVYRYIGKIILGNISSMTETGLFENADRVTQIVLGIIGGIGYVMQQRMSNLYANKNENDANKLLNLSFILTGFISCALSFGLSGIAGTLAPVYFGDEFKSCDILISLLSLEIIYVSFANVVRTNYLIPKEKDKEYVVSVIVGAVVNILVNFILIPFIGALGAVIAVMAADLVVFIMQSYAVRNEIKLKEYVIIYGSFMIIGGIMWICTRIIGLVMGTSVFSLVIQICIGAAVYILFSFIYLKIFQKDVFNMVKKLMPKR